MPPRRGCFLDLSKGPECCQDSDHHQQDRYGERSDRSMSRPHWKLDSIESGVGTGLASGCFCTGSPVLCCGLFLADISVAMRIQWLEGGIPSSCMVRRPKALALFMAAILATPVIQNNKVFGGECRLLADRTRRPAAASESRNFQ